MYHDGTQFQWFAEAQGLTHPYVYSLTASASTLWVGTGGEGIWRLQDGHLTRDSSFSQNDMPAMIYHLLTDSQGRLWAATEGGLLTQNTEGSWYKLPSQGLPAQSVTLLAEGRPGAIWAGTAAGLARWNGTSFEPYAPLLNLPITALFSDRTYALWVGSGDTLFRLTDDGVESLPLNQGSIRAITDDSFGNIWVGTSEGIVRLHPGPIATFGKREGMLVDGPKSATQRKAGGIWCLDATGTLGHFVDGIYTQDSPAGAIKGGALLGMTEDAEGALWVAGTYLYRFFNGQLQTIDLPGESLSLVEALGDELWLAQTEPSGASTLYRYVDGQAQAVDVGFPLRHIQRIYQDRSGQIWITSSGTGVVRIKGSEITHFGSAEGLPSDTVYGITEDADSRIWLVTRGGMGYIEENRAVSLAGIKGTPQNASVHIFLDDKDRFWLTESGLGVH
ncbi:MAG: hypothetical protein EOP50_14945, partial [Sphingobacteriales bacterium]